MSRLIMTLMIVALLIGHGMSYAAAICDHQNAQEHALALISDDGRVAAKAQVEDAAAAIASDDGASFRASAAAWATDMLPTPAFQAPVRTLEPARPTVRDAIMLAGKSVPPLLEPPAA